MASIVFFDVKKPDTTVPGSGSRTRAMASTLLNTEPGIELRWVEI